MHFSTVGRAHKALADFNRRDESSSKPSRSNRVLRLVVAGVIALLLVLLLAHPSMGQGRQSGAGLAGEVCGSIFGDAKPCPQPAKAEPPTIDLPAGQKFVQAMQQYRWAGKEAVPFGWTYITEPRPANERPRRLNVYMQYGNKQLAPMLYIQEH